MAMVMIITSRSLDFRDEATFNVACEQQTHFRSSLLSLGGREATTGNASAVRRLRLTLRSSNICGGQGAKSIVSNQGNVKLKDSEPCLYKAVMSSIFFSMSYLSSLSCLF